MTGIKSIKIAAFSDINFSHDNIIINNFFHYSKESKFSPSKKVVKAYYSSPNISLCS